MNALQHRDVADHANISVVFDSAAIFCIFFADQDYASNAQICITQRGQRQQCVIDCT